jgi:hypothetical protein
MDKIIPIIPYLIPVAVVFLILLVVALVDLVKREKTRGSKWIWLLIILASQPLGPIIYFVFGRVDED